MENKACAIYLRLSKDDGIKGESDSIASQRMFLENYCNKSGFEIIKEYVDDGYSGTNFKRPAFEKMINDALSKKFFCILTKDMSRLGRDYIETGEYIEKFFPENGIRYIAVNDGVDTMSESNGNDMIPFRAVFNDMYAKDISRKVRCALDSRRRSGKFIGSSAPYGYIKDEKDPSKLTPDENTKDIVLRIYREFLEGKSMLSIAKELTGEGIATPSSLKKDNRRKSDAWNSVMIKRILTNPTYKGDITQGFEKKINYKTEKRYRNSKSDLITVRGTHEAIVDDKTFFEVKKRFEKIVKIT